MIPLKRELMFQSNAHLSRRIDIQRSQLIFYPNDSRSDQKQPERPSEQHDRAEAGQPSYRWQEDTKPTEGISFITLMESLLPTHFTPHKNPSLVTLVRNCFHINVVSTRLTTWNAQTGTASVRLLGTLSTSSAFLKILHLMVHWFKLAVRPSSRTTYVSTTSNGMYHNQIGPMKTLQKAQFVK